MSDGPAFDPAILEGKDRAELATIATQLGKKPPARAKKADIVALITSLVGAGAEDASEASGGDDAPSETSEAPDEAPAATRSGRGGGRNSGRAAADETSKDESDEHDGDGPGNADGSAGAEDKPEREQADRDSQNRNQGGRNQNQGGQNQGNGNQNQGGQDKGNQGQGGQNQGNGNQGGQGNQNQGGQGDDPESGNRRRRRRGRDRNRGDQDDQVQAEPVAVSGMVDLRNEGYGFLRVNGYLPSPDDAYISVKQTRQFGLRTGDLVAGKSRAPGRNEKNPALIQVEEVNGASAHNQPSRARFEELTPLFPDERLTLEGDDPSNMTVRIVDLLAPIGKGQRGLIVSPPKAGKTTIVKEVVRALETNHPDVEVIVLLVDERPEEVTDMSRWLLRGTVAASTFDRPAEEHTSVAELVIERAKRMVETGKDVVVVLDGITRLARAYNLAAPASGRTMAGGIETSALYPPKKFFGAARNAEEGGSLTILATALVDTNTRMDEVIFEEFKGTGNMELKLDRRLAERRIFPAIDVDASSTRHDELLFERGQLAQIVKLRRVLGALADESGSNASGVEMLVDRLGSFKTNAEFLAEIAKS